MWEPRHLIPLWAFTACYGESFIFLPFCRILMANAFENEPFGRRKRSRKNNRILLQLKREVCPDNISKPVKKSIEN
jgi:hypothetical protein